MTAGGLTEYGFTLSTYPGGTLLLFKLFSNIKCNYNIQIWNDTEKYTRRTIMVYFVTAGGRMAINVLMILLIIKPLIVIDYFQVLKINTTTKIITNAYQTT